MESDSNKATRLIDVKLAEYEQRILELKARRNTQSPIARLPNEILVEIFVLLRAKISFLQWHHVSHICRHWRGVALEAADLWTQPPTFSHDYTLVMLERSRNRLLNILINQETARITTDAILQHLGRIKSLTLVQETAEGLKYIQDQLVNSTLQLCNLQMINDSPRFVGDNLHTLPPFRLAPLQTASLRLLNLIWMDMDWQILPIRRLECLILTCTRISNPPSWTEFHGAMDGMPSLENFEFSLTDFRLDIPGPGLPQPLNMPRLRRLVISAGTNAAITYFLSNVVFPRLQRLYVTTRDSDDYQDMIHAMATKMDIGLLDSLRFWSNKCALSRMIPLPDRRMVEFSTPIVDWQDPPTGLRFARSIASELATHPTSRIVHLELCTYIVSHDLLETFGYSLPYLKSIRVFASWKEVIYDLVVPRTHSFGEPIPFPNLQTIELEGVRYDIDGDGLYSSQLHEPLCECLRTRSEHHSPVSKVFLGCELTSAQVDELRGLVGDLEFGGEYVESETE